MRSTAQLPTQKQTGARLRYYLLIFSPLLFLLAALFIGRYPVSFESVIRVLWCKLTQTPCSVPHLYQTLIWEIRLPRAVLAAMVGASLSISGASFQGLFRNPLVSPGILGVSAGAGFGAALAILLFHSSYMTYLFAFLFGVLAVILSYMAGTIYSTTPNIMLVLGGVIVSSVFSALISFAKYIADPNEELPAIVFWLMGSLASASFHDILLAGVPMLVGIIGLVVFRWRINILSMGDKEARSLGLNPTRNKAFLIACATLATAGAVCVSGMIGWVGLVMPHIGRMLVGNNNRFLIPVSLSLGAVFLISIDSVARIISGSEVPLGVLTALIGAPFFVYLLKTTKGGGW